MEENTRSDRRTRKRPPYDLRRKVLLKNFLREQMINVPELTSSTNPDDSENVDTVSTESSSEAVNVEDESLNRSENEEPIIESSSPSEEKNAETSAEEDQNRGVEHHPNSPWKSTLSFDFSKITDLKLSRLLPVKRKSTPLSPEDIKLITKKTKLKQLYEKKCKGEIIKSSTPLKRRFGFAKFSSKSDKSSLQPKGIFFRKAKSKTVKTKHLLKSSSVESKPEVTDANKTANEHALDNFRVRVRKVIDLMQDLIKRSKEEDSLITQNVSLAEDMTFPSYFFSSKEDFIYRNLETRKMRQKVYVQQQKSLSNLLRIEKSLTKTLGKPFRTSKRPDVEMDKKENDPLCEATSNRSSDAKTSKSCTVSTQCIPEDMNSSLLEIRKLERVNRRLREENKLLSESLSSIMADVDVAFNPYRLQNQKRHSVDRSRNETFNGFDRRYPVVSAPSTPRWTGNDSNTLFSRSLEQCFKNTDPGRTQVLRSRSVLEQAERRREIRLRLSSKSMCHRPYVRISPRTLYKAKPCIITSCSSSEESLLSNIYQPPTLLTRLDQNNFKTSLSRRSSMPEKNHRRTLPARRSSCAFENKSSYYKSFLSLPKEAFY